ncbi:glycosyl transferase family 2 [Candidatus Woesearchaeota archaeon CG10_big_fil_rev_8_21_14_0_10_44_13]|nr:MAG: glycosyl transferase family 2 [Candidatus Woesearchaeota archaeon CG10_big_fil_rev_8_21_14_0_10_44_13]
MQKINEGKSISAVIVTKNEEENIKDCLESIKWVDEIVIVDDFSTDKTRGIAIDYGARVYQKKWRGYSRTKNYAVSLARGPWILLIDADEVLSKGLKEEILHELGNDNNEVYRILIAEFLMGRDINGNSGEGMIRLFRKGSGRFMGEVHEKFSIDRIKVKKMRTLRNPLFHDRKRTIERLISKIDKYSSIEAEGLYKKGFRPGIIKILFSPPIYFFRSYIIERRFLKGKPGLVYSTLMSYYVFLNLAKTKEMDMKNEKG